MEFRRITNLPPYVFTIINKLKIEARRAGVDVIDLGFGNPDIPSPEIAVEKLAEAARIARNHRYSMRKGLPNLRQAAARLYERNWGVTLDPETEITNTIGSKEGFSHLMWVLLAAGRRRHRAGAQLPDPHLRSALRRCRPAPGAHAHRRRLLRGPRDGVDDRLAQAAGADHLVPAQPDRRVRRPRLHAACRRLLPRARDDRRARLRLRRRGVRRLPAAVHPAGQRGQGVRRRALLDDEELLDGRLAGRVPVRATPRSSRRS